MESVLIASAPDPQTPDVCEVLAGAYTGNSTHVAIFGKDNVALMAHCCAMLNREGETGYMERLLMRGTPSNTEGP